MQRIAAAALCLLMSASPAGAVPTLAPITYATEQAGVPWVREACGLETRLFKDINSALASTAAASAEGALRVSIVDLLGVRGDFQNGPKAIMIRVELLKDEQVQRRTDMTRTTQVAGSACTMLDRDSSALGQDVAKWIVNPSYRNDDRQW